MHLVSCRMSGAVMVLRHQDQDSRSKTKTVTETKIKKITLNEDSENTVSRLSRDETVF